MNPEAKPQLDFDWPIRAGVVDRVLNELQAKVKRRKSRRRRATAAAACACLGLALLAWAVPTWLHTGTLSTGSAERRTLTLEDGSHVDLSARTVLRTDFRYGRRVVTLDQGEAYFSVAKDHGRPFFVDMPVGRVHVTGTVFDVRLADSKDAAVTLVEGSITLERPATDPVKLFPAQQFSINGTDVSLRTLSSAELENISAWREGRVAFDGLTLGETAGRLSAYFGSPIAVDPQIANLQPGGGAPLKDLKSVLDALQEALPIRVVILADGSYQLQPR